MIKLWISSKFTDIVAAAVLSGNRNFEGRVHPLTRANYLASPPLVVAYALAGTVGSLEFTHTSTDQCLIYRRNAYLMLFLCMYFFLGNAAGGY